jgi:hypothetical protein
LTNFQVFLDMLKHPKSSDLKAGLADLDKQINEAPKVAG